MLLFGPQGSHVIDVSYGYYEKILLEYDTDENRDIQSDNFYYFKLNEQSQYLLQNQGSISLQEVFNHVRLFKSAYEFFCNKEKVSKFFQLLNLGEHLSVFQNVYREARSQIKYDTPTEENKLVRLFRPLIQTDNIHEITSRGSQARDLQLTEAFVLRVCQAFEVSAEAFEEQAKLFFCLAALFVLLSSSYYFASELSSPLPLRNMAIGFLNKAISSNSSLVAIEDVVNWKNRLTGEGDAFTCTAVLFEILKPKFKNYPYFSQVIPMAWQ